MAQPANRGNDASMSILDAVHKMKLVGQASYPKALRRVRGRLGNGGFSLIELMVVVMIIGILMAIAMPQFKLYQIRSYKAAAKAVLMDIASRQEQFIVQNRAYFYNCAAGDTAALCPAASCTAAASSTTMFSLLGVTMPQEALDAYDFAICAPATSATNAALAGMPTFQATSIPRAGTVQAAESTLWVNQFGLRMPISQW